MTLFLTLPWTSLVAQMVKVSVYNAGDLGLVPGLGRFPGEGNGNPLQYSCLENPMDGGTWCRLLSMGLQRVGHDWVTSLSLFLIQRIYIFEEKKKLFFFFKDKLVRSDHICSHFKIICIFLFSLSQNAYLVKIYPTQETEQYYARV